jgi:translation initiation factor 2 subunit 1
MGRDEWPEKDELVLCTVKELKSFGAFVAVEEYGGKEGLIHVSEISSGWVKHLRDYVREEQKVVCKVLHVDPQKGHIDLSLKAVKDGQKREKIKEWKNEQKAKTWLALALSDPSYKIGKEELIEIELTLRDAYGTLYDAFEDAVRSGNKALITVGIKEDYTDAIYKVAIANVKLPFVHIAGYLELICPSPNGVEIIKEALVKAEEAIKTSTGENIHDTQVECFYIGAPRYRIRVTAPNYKEAESILSDAATSAIAVVKMNDGSGKFYRNIA